MSAEEQPAAPAPEPRRRPSELLGFLVAAAGVLALSLAFVASGPLILRWEGFLYSFREACGAWVHASLYAGLAAAVGAIGLAVWSDTVRRESAAVSAFLGLVAIAFGATFAGVLYIDGPMQKLLIRTRVERADDYYVEAMAMDLADYRRAAGGARIGSIFDGVVLAKDPTLASADRRLQRARAAAAKYRGRDKARQVKAVRRAEAGPIWGAARTKAMGQIHAKYRELGLLADRSWDLEESVIAELQDLSDLLKRNRGAWRTSGDRVLVSGPAFQEGQEHFRLIRDLELEERRVTCRMADAVNRPCGFLFYDPTTGRYVGG
jgi:hypothetical protein